MSDRRISSEKISFRDATLSDVELLERWEDQPHIIAAGIEDWPWHEEFAEKPSWRLQLIAELDGRPIGFVQIIDPALESSHYWGDIGPDYRAVDIFIGEKNDLGQGYGTTMMSLALNKCFATPQVTAVLIDPIESNKRAHQFYKRLGFQYLENRTFDDDDCCVFILSREDWLTKRNSQSTN